MSIATYITSDEIKAVCSQWRQEKQKLAFIPTMGALHQGHLSLVEKAKQNCERVVVSIFVNPTQFGPNEDFAKYPRTLKADLAKLEGLGVDGVFAPNTANMYVTGHQTFVENNRMSTVLCGAYRPKHFQGVLTVVCKLLNIVQPDLAIFGKKDYQQYLLIRTMVRDLDMPMEILGAPTVRDDDGLAMSSRNLRLSDEKRKLAPQIYQGLSTTKRIFDGGCRDVSTLMQSFRDQIDHQAFQLQYAEIRGADDLELISDQIEKPAIFAVAAFLDDVRLIDNVELG